MNIEILMFSHRKSICDLIRELDVHPCHCFTSNYVKSLPFFDLMLIISCHISHLLRSNVETCLEVDV